MCNDYIRRRGSEHRIQGILEQYGAAEVGVWFC